ncbi:MAG: delta-lactam-biosynthetic de-N-acetylase [Clostridiales bacterium]|jgi:peptidoglycan-N-acetylmuramic acid deacetylase|nr:delta-lactam-biosynthetic de-N-acetylase [Eubacteriales bacterium]MDH7566394.1 delta-lactam-biosynthetic de-N-acetylase [Clostridiales bacterium]
MSKWKAVFTVLILVLLSGCAGSSSAPASAAGEDAGKAVLSASDDSNEKISGADNGAGSVKKEEDVKKEDKPSVVFSDPIQPEPRESKGEKLDFTVLDKLDNTKYGWGLTLNNQHTTPGVSSQAKKLLSKYDGFYVGDTSKKIIYLTFDEGYENGYTPKILDTLKENDVKSIFFVTGPYVRENPQLVKRMLDEGHLVGNHTINHPSLPQVSDASLEKELYGLEKEFSAAFGKGFKYMRPPMGEYSERVLAAAKQLGYKTIFWSFAYLDYDVKNQKGADHAYNMVMKNLHNGAVILLHAVSKDNAEALDRIIKGIRDEGYEIRPFDL